VDNSDIEPELLYADEIVTGLVLAMATAHAVRPVGDSVRGGTKVRAEGSGGLA